MTNTTYFYNTLREYYSSSSASSSFSEQAAETTINAMNSQPVRTDEKDTSPKFVSPTSLGSTFKRFNFAELKAATRNFDPSAALESSFGSVFKGWVDGHKLTAKKRGKGCIAVCVKVFKGFQFHTEYWARVNSFAHVEHPNLVRLLGYGFDGTLRVLVYEFTSQGSLEDHLSERSSQNFTWSLRMKVALDAAKGLAFIHSFPKELIHGYITPSNILVDSNYNAKLSGFELTKDRPTTFPEEVMDNGDFSYSINSATIHDAPEYRYTGQFSAKSDVFSFGVVFLEILCGRRAFEDSWPSEEQNLLKWTMDSRPSECQNLLEWIDSHSNLLDWTDSHSNLLEWTDSHWNRKFKIIHALDSRIAGQYSKDTVLKAVKLAVKCLSIQAKLRPTMDEVVQALEELQN